MAAGISGTSLLGIAAIIAAGAIGGSYLINSITASKNPVAAAANALQPFAPGLNQALPSLGYGIGAIGYGAGQFMGQGLSPIGQGLGYGAYNVLTSASSNLGIPAQLVSGFQQGITTFWNDIKSGWNWIWTGSSKGKSRKYGGFYLGSKPGWG